MFATGQEDQDDDVASAAGTAAYKEALKADWPPDKGDTEAIGAATATAACHAAAAATYGATEIAAQLGWCSALGEYIAGAVYDIIDSFWASNVFVAPQYDHVFYQRTRKAGIRLANLRLKKGPLPAPPQDDVTWELLALENWGVPGARLAAGGGPTDAQEGPWRPYYNETGLYTYLQKLAAAESARAAEISALEHPSPSKSSGGAGLGTVVVVAAGLGGALWLASLL